MLKQPKFNPKTSQPDVFRPVDYIRKHGVGVNLTFLAGISKRRHRIVLEDLNHSGPLAPGLVPLGFPEDAPPLFKKFSRMGRERPSDTGLSHAEIGGGGGGVGRGGEGWGGVGRGGEGWGGVGRGGEGWVMVGSLTNVTKGTEPQTPKRT